MTPLPRDTLPSEDSLQLQDSFLGALKAEVCAAPKRAEPNPSQRGDLQVQGLVLRARPGRHARVDALGSLSSLTDICAN